MPTQTAMGTALFSFMFTGLFATWLYQRHGSIDWTRTVPLCLGALLFGFPGSLVNAVAPSDLLNYLLAGVILFSGLYTLFGKAAGKPGARPLGRERVVLFLVGAVVGFGSGLTGVGGPVLSVPIMLMAGFPPLLSVAAGQVVQLAGALSGSVGNIMNGVVDFRLAALVTLFQLVGVVAGVRLAHAVSGATLKKTVAVVCLAVGSFIVWRTVGP